VGEQAACVTCPNATTVRAFAEDFTHGALEASDTPDDSNGQAAVAQGLWPLIRQVRRAAALRAHRLQLAIVSVKPARVPLRERVEGPDGDGLWVCQGHFTRRVLCATAPYSRDIVLCPIHLLRAALHPSESPDNGGRATTNAGADGAVRRRSGVHGARGPGRVCGDRSGYSGACELTAAGARPGETYTG
jgi:hypothetical protein